MRDMPYIDAVIAGFCTSCDEPNAAEQAIVFDQSLERSGWAIIRADEIERLRAALTPSAETKAAYIGEFHFNIAQIGEDGEEGSLRVTVPWPTVKEIMAAIRKYASHDEQASKE